jgi:hypothetical protein
LTSLAYLMSALVFAAGFWALRRIFWFDSQLRAISKAERQSSIRELIRRDYGHLRAVYFSEDATRLNPKGERIIVNAKTKTAYYMNHVVDAFVFQNAIQWERYPDISQEDWCRRNNLNLVPEPPREDSLA